MGDPEGGRRPRTRQSGLRRTRGRVRDRAFARSRGRDRRARHRRARPGPRSARRGGPADLHRRLRRRRRVAVGGRGAGRRAGGAVAVTRARRSRLDPLHVGHDRQAQGRDADPSQPAGQRDSGRRAGAARRRRPGRDAAAAVPRQRPGRDVPDPDDDPLRGGDVGAVLGVDVLGDRRAAAAGDDLRCPDDPGGGPERAQRTRPGELAALHHLRRGAAVGRSAGGVSDEVRDPDPRGLRPDRDRLHRLDQPVLRRPQGRDRSASRSAARR